MKLSRDEPEGQAENATPDRAASYLVRIWKEPVSSSGKSILRGYFRNLKSGEERYVADPQALLAALQVEQPPTGELNISEVTAAAKRGRDPVKEVPA